MSREVSLYISDILQNMQDALKRDWKPSRDIVKAGYRVNEETFY
jgi:hypothetical protein